MPNKPPNFSKVEFTTDAIWHSREADKRGDESNVVYLLPSERGTKLINQTGFGKWIIQPRILEAGALCKYLLESKIIEGQVDESVWSPNVIHYSYIYPATLLAPNASIPTAHSYIAVYGNRALKPTEPLDFIISYKGFIYALAKRYIIAVAHYESDYKTLRRIIPEQYWKKITIFVPSAEFVKGIATAKPGVVGGLDTSWEYKQSLLRQSENTSPFKEVN
jgi:hypothetical protein